jgi:hypothetical protein
MHTNKRSKKQKPAAPAAPSVVDFDAVSDEIYLAAHTLGAKYGCEVILIVVSPAQGWRAKWGPMNLDRVTLFIFKLLTTLQRMLP